MDNALYDSQKKYSIEDFEQMRLSGLCRLEDGKLYTLYGSGKESELNIRIDGKIYPLRGNDPDLPAEPMFDGKTFTPEEFEALNLTFPCEHIGGQIYSMSPAPNIRHQKIVGKMYVEISNYITRRKGNCEVFTAPTDVKVNGIETVQPDIFVTCSPENFDEQKYNGAPDWIIEVLSPTTSRKDFNQKFDLYREAGVKEYWVIDPVKEKVKVFLFRNGRMGFFTFDDEITVDLYKNAPEPLVITINDLLQ